VIPQCGPWRGVEEVELAILEWASCYKEQRLLILLEHYSAGGVRGDL
jgi:hypothetical protein